MVLSSDRDHVSRNVGIRASVDGYAAAFTPRRRASGAPLVTSKSADLQLNAFDNQNPKQSKSIMSSLFSRFSSRNKPRLNIAIESPRRQLPHQQEQDAPSPGTPLMPVGKRSPSIPIVDPLPAPSAFRTLEQFPLCVSYVQAVKTSSLPACTLSSEKILRQEVEKVKSMGVTSKRGRSMRHVSTKSADLDWTKKLFVLVPGILLQYSGHGTDDRLPEKVLQLTSSSLAFASDAIPGRPWVLQVYGSAGEDGTLLPERRSAFIAKVTFRAGMRNSASALLLVFESPEEMDSWMGVLRAEATRLAGGGVPRRRKSSPGLFGKSAGFGNERLQKQNTGGGAEKEEIKEFDLGRYSRRIAIGHEDNSKTERRSSSDENTSKRISIQYRNSTDAERSIISNDQILLDQLQETSRLSLHSGGDKTRVITVSPDTSPERYSTRSITSYKRQSLALSTQSRSSLELQPPPPPASALSAIDKDGNLYWIPRTPSPPISNFSLPTYTRPRPLSTSIPPIPPIPTPPPSMLSREPNPPQHLEDLRTLPARRPRPVSTQSNPASPYLSTPKLKPRPLSMVDSSSPHKTQYHHHNHQYCHRTPKSELPSTTPARRVSAASSSFAPPITILSRPRSLRRRSLSALGIPNATALAHGAPPHPPPSMPLPKVPSEQPSSVSRSSSVNKRRERRKSSKHGLGIDIDPPEEKGAGKRYSFCAVGNSGNNELV